MNFELVRSHFESQPVVLNYMRAVSVVGLWESERIVIEKFIPKKGSKILELGCGAGRIGLNLIKRGYKNIILSDFSPAMVEASKDMAQHFNLSADCRVCDATKLSEFEENSFEAVIFGFNGLMQIPGRENRLSALSEIFKILKPGGVFIFTTHDRILTSDPVFWEEEKKLWEKNLQNPKLKDFGDRVYDSPEGEVFIHLPILEEIAFDLNEAGFLLVFESLRSAISSEKSETREFSDECIFRVAMKPTADKVQI